LCVIPHHFEDWMVWLSCPLVKLGLAVEFKITVDLERVFAGWRSIVVLAANDFFAVAYDFDVIFWINTGTIVNCPEFVLWSVVDEGCKAVSREMGIPEEFVFELYRPVLYWRVGFFPLK
jgi:hypothetical protein